MRVVRWTLVLGVALALAACSAGDHTASGPTPRAEEVATPELAGAESGSVPGSVPGSGSGSVETDTTTLLAAGRESSADDARADARADYGRAYGLLYTAMEPSDALIDQWNAAAGAEDWTRVRVTSTRLADALETLQTTVLAADWPADAQAAAQDFAIALDDEIGWYSYVSIARDEDETVDAVQQPWTDVAVTASDELWTVLENGLATEG